MLNRQTPPLGRVRPECCPESPVLSASIIHTPRTLLKPQAHVLVEGCCAAPLYT